MSEILAHSAEPNRIPVIAHASGESTRLDALRCLQIMDTDPEPCFDKLTRMAASFMKAENAALSFMDETRVWAKSSVNGKLKEFPRHLSFHERIILEGQPVILLDLEDLDEQDGFNEAHCHLELCHRLGLRFFAGVPVRAADGSIVGALCVRGSTPRDHVPPEHLALLECLADLATEELELRRLRCETYALIRSVHRPKDAYLAASVRGCSSTLSGEWPQPEDIRNGLEQDQFVLYYQPEVDLDSGRVVGLEALIRWQHPERGLIQPCEFIPHAEENGLILPLGDWGLEQACRQLRLWTQEFSGLSELRVCVNLSARQFSRSGLVDHIESLLLQNGLSAMQLGLEMTETSLNASVELTTEVLNSLHRLGVSLHMDDFGTGYSSLSYLHCFPFDVLKIDRSFIDRMTSGDQPLQLIQTILDLARALGMDVIAEGIETEAQLSMLRQMGCRYGQGFLFSRPIRADQVPARIRDSSSSCDSDWPGQNRLPKMPVDGTSNQRRLHSHTAAS